MSSYEIVSEVLSEGTGILIVTFLSIVLFYLWKINRNLPPGPWGLPFFGYYPFLIPKAYIQLQEMTKKYGEVISFRSLGGNLIIVLNGISVIKEACVNRPDEFTGRPIKSNLLEWLDDGLGITQAEKTVWKDQKRFFLQGAKNFGFGKMEIEPLFHKLMESSIENIRSLKGKSFNPLLDVSYVTSNVIGTILFKTRFERNDPRFIALAQGLHDLLLYFGDCRTFIVGPILSHFVMKFVPSGIKCSRVRHLMRTMTKEFVDEHVRTFNPENLRDFTDTYLEHMKKLSEKGQLSKSSFGIDRMSAVTMNMLMEGTDSIGSTVCSLLAELARHPEIQKKAQQELDTVVGRARLPSWMDKQELPYTESVMLELFRVNQAFYFSTLYSNYEEATLRGYRIPKRSVIVANLWSVNYDPKNFPCPYKFDPCRFLSEDGQRIKKEGPMPFGTGKRSCTGESLAQMEVFLFLSCLMQNFDFYPGNAEDHIRAVPRE